MWYPKDFYLSYWLLRVSIRSWHLQSFFCEWTRKLENSPSRVSLHVFRGTSTQSICIWLHLVKESVLHDTLLNAPLSLLRLGQIHHESSLGSASFLLLQASGWSVHYVLITKDSNTIWYCVLQLLNDRRELKLLPNFTISSQIRAYCVNWSIYYFRVSKQLHISFSFQGKLWT